MAWEKIWLSLSLSLSPLVLNLKGIRSTPGLHWQLGTCSPACVSKDTSEVTTFVEGAQVFTFRVGGHKSLFFSVIGMMVFHPSIYILISFGRGRSYRSWSVEDLLWTHRMSLTDVLA